MLNRNYLFLDYRVWGEEGNDSVTITIQFHLGGEYGPVIGIEPPAYVTLDGETVPVDSSSLTGPVFALTKSVKKFTGKHSILYTSAEKKKYREDFSFKPFSMITHIPDTVSRGRLTLDFSGLEPVDYVRVLMTDTTYDSEGINQLDTVVNNRVNISRGDLF